MEDNMDAGVACWLRDKRVLQGLRMATHGIKQVEIKSENIFEWVKAEAESSYLNHKAEAESRDKLGMIEEESKSSSKSEEPSSWSNRSRGLINLKQ